MALLGKIPLITNLILTDANTEYSYIIPTGTKKYTFQCRTDNNLKYAYVEDQSGSVFSSIPEGASKSEDNLNTAPELTLYLQSPTAGVVVEIETWST